MNNQSSQRPFSQRQLRVGELVKQNLGELFIRNEKPTLNISHCIAFNILSNIQKDRGYCGHWWWTYGKFDGLGAF